jgi:hypothetical protein
LLLGGTVGRRKASREGATMSKNLLLNILGVVVVIAGCVAYSLAQSPQPPVQLMVTSDGQSVLGAVGQ